VLADLLNQPGDAGHGQNRADQPERCSPAGIAAESGNQREQGDRDQQDRQSEKGEAEQASR